jgi:hypothetical protein
VFILKKVKVACFDRLLQVFILKGLRRVMEVEGRTERSVLSSFFTKWTRELEIDLAAVERERRSVCVSDGFFDGKHEGRIAWRVSVISST